MFVIMSKAKFYALEAQLDELRNNQEACAAQLVRCEKRLKLCRETEEKLIMENIELKKRVEELEKRVSCLAERLDEIDKEYSEMLAAAEKAQADFSEGVNNILNYGLGGGKK